MASGSAFDGSAMDTTLQNSKVGWFSNAGIVKLNMILLLAQVSSYATGFDGSMMNGLQSLDSWQESFNNPDANMLALLNIINSVGQLLGMPFCAFLCDYLGRKKTLLLGAAILLIGGILQAAAQNTGMFIAARGILGFGLVINITAAPLLLTELAYPTHRSPSVSIYNALWNLGALVAAWTTYGSFRINSTWAWRLPSLLQVLSSVVQLGLFFLIEESPRWLISKDRHEEAKQLLVKYHANGDPNQELVAVEFEEIKEALHLEIEAAHSTSYLSFFSTSGNRKRFFIIVCVGFFSQWSGNGLISYYLSLILNSIGYTAESTQTLINALLTLWNLISMLVFATLTNKFNRRLMFLVSTGGMLITYVVWTGLQATYEKQTGLTGSGSDGYAKGILAIIFLYNLAFNIGWGPLQVTYVTEILPFNLRARGLTLYNFSVACALIFNQYANPVGITNITWRYYIVYDVWLAVEFLVVYFLFIETRGLSLEETAALVDGVEVQEKLAEATTIKVSPDTKADA